MSDSDDMVPTTKRKSKGKGKPRAGGSAARGLPAFLQKLYAIVSDPELDDRIHWSENGDSFIVPSQEKVSQEILPQYFKHSNFGSFVRQLNMYGFRKVPQMQAGAQKAAYAGNELEFRHDAFKRDQPELMSTIERKKGGDDDKGHANSAEVQTLLARLEVVSKRQDQLSQEFEQLAATNTQLWTEQQMIKTKHDTQQRAINAIVQFLAQNYKGQLGAEANKDLPSPGVLERFTQMHEQAAPANGSKAVPHRSNSFSRLLLEGPEAPSRLQELRTEAGKSGQWTGEQKDSPNSNDGRFSTLPDSPPNTDQSGIFSGLDASNMDPGLSALVSVLNESNQPYPAVQNAFNQPRALPAPPAAIASTSNEGALVPYSSSRQMSDIQADMTANQRNLDEILADLNKATFGADGQYLPALDDMDFSQYLNGGDGSIPELFDPPAPVAVKEEEVTPVFDAPTPRTRSQAAGAVASPGPTTRTSPRKRASSTASFDASPPTKRTRG